MRSIWSIPSLFFAFLFSEVTAGHGQILEELPVLIQNNMSREADNKKWTTFADPKQFKIGDDSSEICKSYAAFGALLKTADHVPPSMGEYVQKLFMSLIAMRDKPEEIWQMATFDMEAIYLLDKTDLSNLPKAKENMIVFGYHHVLALRYLCNHTADSDKFASLSCTRKIFANDDMQCFEGYFGGYKIHALLYNESTPAFRCYTDNYIKKKCSPKEQRQFLANLKETAKKYEAYIEDVKKTWAPSPTPPQYSQQTQPNQTKPETGGLTLGAKVGLGVGIPLLVIIACIICCITEGLANEYLH